MPTTPVPGFITKKEASDKYERSHRQLTRDIADAMKLQNHKVLEHCRLRTEDGEVLEGIGMMPERIDQLCLDGKNPVWYFRTAWLEKQYGKRGHPRRPGTRHVPRDTDSRVQQGSEPASRPEVVDLLRERIEELERDKQDLREEMKIKNQQIDNRVEREKETNALIRDLHTLMADLQQRALPPPVSRTSPPSASPYIVADTPPSPARDAGTPSSIRDGVVESNKPTATPTKGTQQSAKATSQTRKKKGKKKRMRSTVKKKPTSSPKKSPAKVPTRSPKKSKRLWSRLFSR